MVQADHERELAKNNRGINIVLAESVQSYVNSLNVGLNDHEKTLFFGTIDTKKRAHRIVKFKFF